MILYCATKNPGKLREFRASGLPVEPLPHLDEIAAPPETGETFEENAVQKAEFYAALSPGWVFSEDSGICVDALNGAPGPLSARFAGESATDAENNALLLERLRDQPNRHARYVCVIALCRKGRLLEIFRGEAEGEILTAPRGNHGFGYDPLFYFPPLGRAFAELSGQEKLEVSHRGRAIAQLKQFIGKISATF